MAGYGPEDLAVLYSCIHAADPPSLAQAEALGYNTPGSQLLMKSVYGPVIVLKHDVSHVAGELDLAAGVIESCCERPLLELTLGEVARMVKQRVEAAAAGGVTDRLHRENIRRKEAAFRVGTLRHEGEAQTASLLAEAAHAAIHGEALEE